DSLLCLSALAACQWFFLGNDHFGTMFLVSVFFAGGLSAAFYGWLPLYLPELFRTNVRATGQGFSFNFGRVIAAVGALQTGNLMAAFQDNVSLAGVTLTGGYPLACPTMSPVYLGRIGLILPWPRTKGCPLPAVNPPPL